MILPRTCPLLVAAHNSISRYRLADALRALALVLACASTGCEAPPPERVVPKADAPVAPLRVETTEIPEVKFVDVTKSAGISFVHNNGMAGQKLLPETMGSGCAFLDYDGDGDPDLLFVNSEPWPEDPRATGAKPAQALYRNDGDAKFTDVTKEAGLDISLFGMGAAVGDYDNDDDPDLYLTTIHGGRLLRNDRGRFVDVTDVLNARAGDAWLSSAAFFDIENDGDLDLFICTYVKWSKEFDLAQTTPLAGVGRGYVSPSAFEGALCVLLRNDRTTFTDISQESGIQVRSFDTRSPIAKSLGVAPWDIDGDGFVDLAVANDTVPNFLFRNLGNGRFEEIASTSGVAYDGNGQARGAMGIDWSHFMNDQNLALAIGNFANEMTALYVTEDPKQMLFADHANIFGLGAPTQNPLKFGLFFFDYDNDGRQDLLQVNGHLETDIEKTQASMTYRQPAQLFWNTGKRDPTLFTLVPPERVGPDLSVPIVGRGSAYADIDHDGDLDLAISDNGGPARLLLNEGGSQNRWIRLKLVGRKSNRDAIGAIVVVETGEHTQTRQLFPAKGYLSSVEPVLTFGLGTAAVADSISIRWPSGLTTKFDTLNANHTYVIDEEEGLKRP